jgi:hypothetical protein
MTRRKSLTFKAPDQMNLITVLIIVLCVISPQMRYTVGSAFVLLGQTLQGEVK